MRRYRKIEPIRKGALKEEIAGPTVGGVRTTERTYAFRDLDPRRLAWVLREAEQGDPIRYLELAEDMEEKDLHYLSVLGTRRRQVSQLTVTVEPADDSAEAERDAELVRSYVARDELADELFDLLDAVSKGFSVSEIVWEQSERQWMPARVVHRLPTWFRYDQETQSRLQRRDETELWSELEPAKFIVHTHAAKSGIAIRGGLARPVAWAWMFKNFGVKDWLRFAEAYGHPLRIGTYDKGAGSEERAVLLRAVRNIASDASAIIPEGMEIKFEGSQGTGVRSDLYRDLVAHFNAEISKAVLGQTLTTQEGSQGTGSYGLGKVHDEVRHDIERSDARQLAATLTRDLARPLVLLNHGPRQAFPRIRIGREEETDLKVLAEALSKLLPHGLRVKATELRERLGLSEPSDDDEVLQGQPQQAPGTVTPELARALARVESDRDDAISQAVDSLMAGGGWEPLMEPVIEPILAAAGAAIGRGESLEQFRERVPELFARIDDGRLTEVLRRMGFSAALAGRSGLEE